jgi:hypothetical protein
MSHLCPGAGTLVDMKHLSNQQFYAYWDKQRGEARAPDRSDIDPDAVRELLGDIFVLGCDTPGHHPFRVAGTRLCALLGRDLKDRSFTELFAAGARREIEDIIAGVTEDMLAAIIGVTATSAKGKVPLELLLLPFNGRAHAPLSLTGQIVPLEDGHSALRDFTVTSWRYLGHRPAERLVPRAIRKLKLARGLMVYEGLR